MDHIAQFRVYTGDDSQIHIKCTAISSFVWYISHTLHSNILNNSTIFA